MTDSPNVAQLERGALCDLFLRVGPDAPTLCGDWRTRDLAAHLVIRESRPDLAAGMFVPFLADRLEREQAKVAAGDWDRLVAQVRSGPPIWNPMRLPALDEATNTMEFVIHHEDVLRGEGHVGPQREVPEVVADATWKAVKRMAGMLMKKSPVAVRFVAPGHQPFDARPGERPVTLHGAPVELALLAYGRAQVAQVTYEGNDPDIAAFKAAAGGFGI